MATYYIDNARGNDNNNGTSITTAWKNLTKIDDVVAAAGDQFLLADDSIWEYDLSSRVVPPTTWSGTKTNPVVIGKYSVGGNSTQKPTIKWNRKLLTTDWTYSAPDNAWVYTAPGNVGGLCLVRLNKTWVASRTDDGVPLASVYGRYHNSGTSFYLYAPSTVDPTTYYGEVLLSTEQGFFSISTNRKWVTIQDIHFSETSTGISAYSASATETGVLVQRVSGDTCSQLIRGFNEGGQLELYITNCSISNFGACAISVGSNTVPYKNCYIEDNKIHKGIYCYSQGAIYVTGYNIHVRDNQLSDVYYGTLDKTTDGAAIYTETGSTNVLVYRNTVTNCHLAFQDNSGRKTTWFSNVVLNCKSIMRVSDQNSNNNMDHLFVNNTCISGGNFSANAGAGVVEDGWRCYKPTGTITSLVVKNNIIIKEGTTATKAGILTPEVTPTFSDYTYNCVVNFSNIAQREFTPFTVETSTNSVTSQPFVNKKLVPSSVSSVYHVGTFVRFQIDKEKNLYHNPPSIGAYEYVDVRGTR
jgi:hypothetical protein